MTPRPRQRGMPMPELVSVVIPNLNNRELLTLCIASLERQDYSPMEIIVVDNGSTDGSAGMVREEFPGVRLIEFDRNKGFSAAVNAGIEASVGAFVALINNDAEADPTWISSLAAAAAAHPEAGFFASKILFHSDRHTIDTFGDGFCAAGFGFKRGWGEYSEAYPDEALVLGACGGAAMYRREMLDDVKVAGEYFDEDFFAFGEDLDLSLRARLLGHKCVAVPGALVFHRLRATAGRGSELSLFLSHRNFILAVIKNFPGSVILRNLPGMLGYLVLAFAADAVSNRRFLYLKSYAAALGMLPMMIRKRAAVQAARKVAPAAFNAALDKGWLRLWFKLHRMSGAVHDRRL